MLRQLALAALAAALSVFAVPGEARVPVNAARDLQNVLACLASTQQYTIYLNLLQTSGFHAILAQYAQTSPVTLLAFPDRAVRRLGPRIRNHLKRSKLIRVLEFSMFREVYTSRFIENTVDSAMFETVLGKVLYRVRAGSKRTLAFKTSPDASSSDIILITKGEVCPTTRTVAVHAVSAVPIPPGLFAPVSSST